jgi:hypothetical protein
MSAEEKFKTKIHSPKVTEPTPLKVRFKLTAFSDLDPDDEPDYIVEDIIPANDVGVFWGPPKCGKSFKVSDIALHIALGWPYRGKYVEQGTVVYCAFEGAAGFKKRAKAFRKHHRLDERGLKPPFYLMGERTDLVKNHRALIAAIRAQIGDKLPRLVVLDTLNRSFVGSESKDIDMTAYIEAADAIREELGCTVAIVHHCGVSGDRPRGHTSLTGAVGFQVEISRDSANNVTMTIEWMKDGAEGETFISKLETVPVGTDRRGKERTSCVVLPVDGVAAPKETKKKLTGAAQIAYRALVEAIELYGMIPATCQQIPPFLKTVSEGRWREVAFKMGISSGGDEAKRKAFERASERLVAEQVAGCWAGLYWIAKKI